MAITEIWQVLPVDAEGSQVTVWLAARFGCCVIKHSQRNAAIVGKSLASPSYCMLPPRSGSCQPLEQQLLPPPRSGLLFCLQVMLLAATWSGR